MFEWLPIVRHLRAEYKNEFAGRIAADDEIRRLREEVIQLSRDKMELQDKLIERAERIADWTVQRSGAPSIFGNEYSVPRPEFQKHTESRSVQARDLEAQGFAQFDEQLKAMEQDLGIN